MRSDIEKANAIIAERLINNPNIAGNRKRAQAELLSDQRMITEHRMAGVLFKECEALCSATNKGEMWFDSLLIRLCKRRVKKDRHPFKCFRSAALVEKDGAVSPAPRTIAA